VIQCGYNGFHVGLGGTYTIGTNVPLLGNVEATVPMSAVVEDAYSEFKAQATRDLPYVALGVFGLVVAGVIVGNLLVPPRSR
jgi:tetrahydromethanopterin S-methyltransferase subunit C